jgi:DNA-binding HxlR family transcriptional regulator
MKISTQIEQKSLEVAYLAIRVSSYIRIIEIAKRIEAISYRLIESIGTSAFEDSIMATNGLKGMIEIGKHLLQIEPVNYKLIIAKINELDTEIRQFAGLSELPDYERPLKISIDNTAKEYSGDSAKIKVTIPKIDIKTSENGTAPINKFDSEVAKIRQEKIVNIIRQSDNGKVQLRDFVAEFPGISERTIRYDLKKLSDEGKIARQGTGGPSNFYALSTTSLNSKL